MARSIYYYTDSRAFGGAERALLLLLETIDRDLWEPALLLDAVPEAEPLAQRARDLGVSVHSVAAMPLGLNGARRVPGLTRFLRAKRPSVFHAHQSWPLAAKFGLTSAVLARVPAIVATVQLIPGLDLDRSSLFQLRALSRACDRTIAVSHDIAAKLVDHFGYPAAKVEVIHNGVRLDRIPAHPPASLRDQLTEGREAPLVLTSARLDEQKGLPTLLEAAAATEGAVFAIAGEGPDLRSLEEQAARMGISDRVRFLGQRADVPELLASADVFALPSLYEGSSLAILEAMAAGCPVVTSSIPGTDELIDDGASGILVPAGNSEGLAQALQRLLADPALRSSLAGAARAKASSDFDAGATTRRLEHAYDDLLRKTGRG